MADCIPDCVWAAIPQRTVWKRITDEIDAIFVGSWPNFETSVQLSISLGAASFAIWLSKMILATRSSAKTFRWLGEAGWCFHCSTENGGAKFRKKDCRHRVKYEDKLFFAMLFYL